MGRYVEVEPVDDLPESGRRIQHEQRHRMVVWGVLKENPDAAEAYDDLQRENYGRGGGVVPPQEKTEALIEEFGLTDVLEKALAEWGRP